MVIGGNSQAWGKGRQRGSEHSECVLLPSEDGVLLIQVGAGSECDEAAESNGGEEAAGGPPACSRPVVVVVPQETPFPAWSFLGPAYYCPLPVSARATQVNPDLWVSGESQSLVASLPWKTSGRGGWLERVIRLSGEGSG